MNREKDSAIVYELVTSKYKIAERNRKAKLRFLNEMRDVPVKRRDSMPSIAQTEKPDVAKVDLSVPGTPISSRILESLKKLKRGNNIESDSETENEDIDDNEATVVAASNSQAILTEGLKKFTADMEKLHDDDVSHDPLQKYFQDSDKKKTYRRDFSEVVSEFSIKKTEPETMAKVQKYFQESERMNSFKRDFTEVVRTFDPRNPSGRDQFTDLKRVGTPISSRLIAVEKLSSAIEQKPVSDIKNSNEIVECDINSQVQLNSNGFHCKSDDVNQHKGNECASDVKGEELKVEVNNSAKLEEKIPTELQEEIVLIKDEAIKEIEVPDTLNNAPPKPKRMQKTDSSSSNISIPGTPISSRELFTLRDRNVIETDDSGSEDDEEGNVTEKSKENDEIRTLAQQFVQEIENLVQKSYEDDVEGQEIVLEEPKKITIENAENGNVTATSGESEGKLNIHEEQQGESNPVGSGNKIEDYFEKSKRENTFKRTFSEVESFNKVSDDAKQKVEDYFKESEQKQSLARPFSQVLIYVEPKIDIEQLLKPGTPVSSQAVMSLKRQSQASSIDELDELDPETIKGKQAFKKAHDALRGNGEEKENISVDDYFQQSQDRKTYRRGFSEVMGELNKSSTVKNPSIEKYFKLSDAQNSFQRPFSEVFQSVPPRIDDILKADDKIDTKNGTPLHYQRSSRTSSVSSTGSDYSESGRPKKSKKHGKKYGIDKYFATSLYRTAYHRSNSRRQSKDDDIGSADELKIVEDEDVFGETDLLSRQEFQHDDETRVTQDSNDVNENQNVTFWRDFLKPYNLNLQTEITITKDDFLNSKRTLE